MTFSSFFSHRLLFHGHVHYILPPATFFSHLLGLHLAEFTPLEMSLSAHLPTVNDDNEVGLRQGPV